MLLTLSQKCPGNGDMGSSASVTILPVQSSSTAAVVCRQWNHLERSDFSSTVPGKEHVACSLTRDLDASDASFKTWDSPSGVFPPPAPTLGSIDRTSSVFIFDLDDTLIPTEWIRSSYAAQKDDSRSPDEVYQVSRSPS